MILCDELHLVVLLVILDVCLIFILLRDVLLIMLLSFLFDDHGVSILLIFHLINDLLFLILKVFDGGLTSLKIGLLLINVTPRVVIAALSLSLLAARTASTSIEHALSNA